MGAALELDLFEKPALPAPTGWDAPTPHDPGDLCPRGHAARCTSLWTSALIQYVRDARSGLAGQMGASREALDDLTGSGEQLAHLCNVMGWDFHSTRAGIIDLLDTGRSLPSMG
ncbi:hypothetical protein P1P91_10930 [Halomonas piscis]|uniref:Uncharacterized protein n=1 Tax=Halomonas piscis TaxID=3031727 RepID=A0ABY9YX33_9GAMM|nr:hypothetical protein [Halomonas piscis]WNK19366.1 hypothetical protein P1P91_10930 [Halomonas piscis]